MSFLTLTQQALLAVARAYRPIVTGNSELVFASDMTGHPQVFKESRPLEWPRRLSATSERMLPVADTAFGLLVRHDTGGNETWQLSLLGSEGELRPLTRDSKAIHQGVVVSPDRKRAGLAYNPDGQDDFRVGVLDLSTGEITDWLRQPGQWRWEAWSPEGNTAVVSHSTSATRVEAFLLEPGQAPVQLLPAARRVLSVCWLPGGTLLARTDLESDFLGMAAISADDPIRPLRWLVREDADIGALAPDPRGERVAMTLNRGLYDELRVLPINGGNPMPTTHLAPGVLYSDNVSPLDDQLAWSPDGSTLLVSWETPTAPADIFDCFSGARWTCATSQPLPRLQTPEAVSYSSFDGLQVPALYYKSGDPPRPAVVHFHGGPEAQIRGNFQPVFHMLNLAGIDVMAPNVRGSDGYGIGYLSLDDKELRLNSVKDGCEAGRFLLREKLATRLAVMGASYGGFMTLAVLVEDPELWQAAVDIVGIADWHTFFANTSGWRRAGRAAEYGDPDGAESEFLAQISPLRHADRIKAPLLVIHGRNDVRVPVGEAEQISRAARDAELLVLEDEGHGIVKHRNRVLAYGRAVEFLEARLRN